MKPPYILALDIGTSSVRAAVYDAEARLLPGTFVKNERVFSVTGDGGAELDAREALAQIEATIDKVLKKAKTPGEEIEYVAVACFWHSLMGIDSSGTPTTKVFGWADTRSEKYVSELRKAFDERKTHNRTGARFHSSFWTAKLLWLKRDYAEIFRKTAKWVSFSDYVALRFFGKLNIKPLSENGWRSSTLAETVKPENDLFTSVSMASATSVFDIRRNVWDEELLDFFDLKTKNLPRIIENDSQTFQLNKEYANRWKRLKNARWSPAIGDGAANNIGANCATKSKAVLMIGTSGAMRVAFEGEPPDEIPTGLWCYRIDRKKIIIGGAISDGGGLYRWLKDNLKLPETDEDLTTRAPDAHGLTFLPFLAGERGTGYHETAKGAILGLQTATDSADILQAALESVAYRFAEIYEQLKTFAEIKEIIASGEAMRLSPVWTQIVADVLGCDLFLPEAPEASLRGAVLLALADFGKIENIETEAISQGREFEFDQTRHEIYQQARRRHRKFYRLLTAESDFYAEEF